MKKKLILAILTLSIFSLIYRVIIDWPDEYLRITFCDVGQGDAILISYKFHQVLIDGGPDDSVLNCLEENIPYWDNSLDAIVATHSDKDHIAGLNSVLHAYDVDLIIVEVSSKNSREVSEFNTQLQKALQDGSMHIRPQAGQSLLIGQKIVLNVHWPLEESRDKKGSNIISTETMLSDKHVINMLEMGENLIGNDRSIVLNMQFGKFLAFLPGDLEREGEQALLGMGMIEDVDILKVAHHGSKTSTTPELVAQLAPEIAVISSGKNNQFGHPNQQVLAVLKQVNAKILRTDQEGSITFASDGEHFWLEE